MKPVLTPEEAAELDRGTHARGVPVEDLMERAGRAVARAAREVAGGAYGRRAVVVCGKGNNGGDGLVAARHLDRLGLRTTVVLLEDPEALREPAFSNARRLSEVPQVRVRTFHERGLDRELARADVAVDALFGTGFRGMPEDAWAAAIAALNVSEAPVVAVDIPSGVHGGTGAVEGEAVRAQLTVTFGAAKLGAVLMPGAEHAGIVRVVDIGFPDDLVHARAWLTEPSDVAGWLPARDSDTHKRASGVLVVVAGSRGMTGAARLIATAAGRIGAGLVIVASPEGSIPQIQAGLTESTFLPLPQTADGTVAANAAAPVLERLEGADALAIGPGLTTDEQTAAFVRDVVRRSPVPIALDADGLNAYTGDGAALADRQADAVLTPHVGEFSRLTGVKARDLEADRPTHVRALAAQTGAVTLLKGNRTVIAAPDGGAFVNVTGSPVLATAGTGDVLTGMIGGLLARGVAPQEAAAGGAYLHGLAGLFAGRDLGEGAVAGDVSRRVPEAVAHVEGA
ncbi:MAG TPA: NAD(P)H-hydrate dehydratase [Actinomycetota bacterium]|nr:NAD(P)H-hydrate dehydratase [Actinomycetota bacterium]